MKEIIIGLGILFLLIFEMPAETQILTKSKRNLVPDDTTAIKIAEAIWLPIYGPEVLNEKPYMAELKDDSTWVVKGTLNDLFGGVAYIEINKRDCRILFVTHGK